MKTKKICVLAAILICGTMVLTSCKSNDDNAVPDTSALELWQAGKTVTAEAVAAFGGIDKCFAAHQGEVAKSMNSKMLLTQIRKEYPSVEINQSNRIRIGLAMKALGYESTDHSNVPFYKVIPLKVA